MHHKQKFHLTWRHLQRGHLLFALGMGAALILAFSASAREPFSSAEVKFSDASPSGLAIMPASCPSDPHWEGECNVTGCTLSVSPSTINAGETSTLTLSWFTGAPPNYPYDSQIAYIAGSITGIGAVYPSGTLAIAAPQLSITYEYSGAYYDSSGNVLDNFYCAAPLTVNNPPFYSLYVNQVELYRSPNSPVSPGDLISYRIYMRNTGAYQGDFTVLDHVPDGTHITWQGAGTTNSVGAPNSCASPDPVGQCVYSGTGGPRDIWWIQTPNNDGFSGYVEFQVQVDATSGQICNTPYYRSEQFYNGGAGDPANTICNPVAAPPPPPPPPPENATIQGFKVVAGNYASITSQPVTVSGVGTDTDNPYAFTVAAGQQYTVSVPAVNGYTIGYTLCMDRTDCHGAPPLSGNSVLVDIPAGTGHFADLWWHYIPDTPVPTGHFDGASCSTLDGWAYDPQNPSASIAVHLYDGSTFVG